MKFKCLIVDDEAPAHKVIAAHISQTDNLQIAGAVFNGKEALDFLMANKVDIIFLDIEMPKLNGLDLLECLPYKPQVILITAYSNFGYEAYQKDVVDYLLKPVPYPRFLKAVNKATAGLLNELHEEKFPVIELKYDGVLKKMNTEKIVYIEAIGNYIKIFSENEKPVIVQQTMKFIESLLPAKYFVRIHKSYIVKKSSIAGKSKTAIQLTNQEHLPLGRKYSILLESL